MPAAVRVAKMSGAGNDFIVLGAAEAAELGDGLTDWVRRACRRGLSLGADGVLVITPAGTDRVSVQFHNPDGSVTFCGNGSRCAARFARRRGLTGDTMILETAAGDVPAEILEDQVRLRLPAPRDLGHVSLELGDEAIEGRHVEAGVPHFVSFVASVADAPLARWGPQVRTHTRFGEAGTNFNVARRRADGSLAMRTWERGVEGETLASGSGAVATALAARLAGGPETVRLVPAGGVPLHVTLPGPASTPEAAILGGDARWIFEGTLDPEGTCGF